MKEHELNLIVRRLDQLYALSMQTNQLVRHVFNKEESILSKQTEEVALLQSLTTDVAAIGANIDTLEAELADADTTPAVDAALAALKDSISNVKSKFAASPVTGGDTGTGGDSPAPTDGSTASA